MKITPPSVIINLRSLLSSGGMIANNLEEDPRFLNWSRGFFIAWKPKNERFKHLQKILRWEKLSQTDLDFIGKEIDFYIELEKAEMA